jgi:hypothetical protein
LQSARRKASSVFCRTLNAPSCACVQLRQRVPKCAGLETCQGAKAIDPSLSGACCFSLTNTSDMQRAISLGRIGRTRIALLCFALLAARQSWLVPQAPQRIQTIECCRSAAWRTPPRAHALRCAALHAGAGR